MILALLVLVAAVTAFLTRHRRLGVARALRLVALAVWFVVSALVLPDAWRHSQGFALVLVGIPAHELILHAGSAAGATMCYMETISQRELRNDNAEIMRRVEQGESYTVTRRGVPVARLSPIRPESDLHCVRPAKTRPVYARGDRVRISTSSGEIIDDLRGER